MRESSNSLEDFLAHPRIALSSTISSQFQEEESTANLFYSPSAEVVEKTINALSIEK